MSLHHIKGSEAFAYSDHRLSPAHGSVRMFSGPRLRRFRPLRPGWPVVALLAAAIAVAGHTLTVAGY